MRLDLLALTEDDLVALANRGTVKRARQEVETRTVILTEAEDGTLTARWSDDAECVLPPRKPLTQAHCTCPAEPPCRHVLRTVMAYQNQTPSLAEGVARIRAGDATLAEGVGASATGDSAKSGSPSARKLYKAGQLFELIRSKKPIARCHSLGTVTRFLVPGDPNFAVCDCGQPAPCDHAWMALWAFEQLPADAVSGLIDTRTEPYPIPTEALDQLYLACAELERVGLAAAPDALWARLQRVEGHCRSAGLIWPAECLAELVTLKEAYRTQDARFDPASLALLIGELSLRRGAIRANSGAVPPLFVRGAAVDRVLEIGSAKLIGLGYRGRLLRSGLQLTGFLQDEDTGQVVVVTAATASRVLTKGMPLGAVTTGRTLVRGGKRSPSGIFSFGRAPAALHPQAYQWEKLRAPVLMEGFMEIEAHLSLLPPKALRPRRLAEDFHVVPVSAIVQVGFDTAEQAVVAQLRDTQGREARLYHPFHHACAAGTEALLGALREGNVCFVAGGFHQTQQGLTVQPTGVVVEAEGTRRLVLPWQEGPAASKTAALTSSAIASDFLTMELTTALGELFVMGLEGIGALTARQWRERARQAEALGFARLPLLLEALSQGEPAAFETLTQLVTLARDA